MPSRPRSRHAGARLMTTRPVWEPSAAATCTPRVAAAARPPRSAPAAARPRREVDTELLQEQRGHRLRETMRSPAQDRKARAARASGTRIAKLQKKLRPSIDSQPTARSAARTQHSRPSCIDASAQVRRELQHWQQPSWWCELSLVSRAGCAHRIPRRCKRPARDRQFASSAMATALSRDGAASAHYHDGLSPPANPSEARCVRSAKGLHDSTASCQVAPGR